MSRNLEWGESRDKMSKRPLAVRNGCFLFCFLFYGFFFLKAERDRQSVVYTNSKSPFPTYFKFVLSEETSVSCSRACWFCSSTASVTRRSVIRMILR